MNLGNLLARHAVYKPNKLAVVFEDKRLTFDEFNKSVNRLANALLDMGVKKGDKISTLLPNCLEILEIYWAAAKIGAVSVPLSTLLLGKGLKSLLDDSDSVALFTNHSFVKTVDEIRLELKKIKPERFIITDSSDTTKYVDYHAIKAKASDRNPNIINSGNDPYNIIYSSGTTGEPKGIVLTHYIRCLYGAFFSSTFRMTPESVIMHTGAIIFNGAFVTFMPSMYLGVPFILHKQFSADEFIASVEKEKVTHVIMVPAQLIAIMNSPKFSFKALESIEMICSVGAPLHKEYKDELNKRLPGRFYELYGLTEGFLTILDKYDADRKSGSVGIPMPLYDMRICDDNGKDLPAGEVGEIVGRGPTLMTEYYKRPDLTEKAIKDGWLFTGDMGYVDEEGFLFLVDRKKDMIITGGVNVYPKDIEEVIVQHPDVMEVAVFGVQNEKWGEIPIAAITLKKPDSISSDALKQWINEHVGAKFQRVHDVLIMKEFPRNVAGKVLKRVMRDDYSASHR
jgi:acyl-CoA synthetase (AMP-forming)/AMP-acid ligase II